MQYENEKNDKIPILMFSHTLNNKQAVYIL